MKTIRLLFIGLLVLGFISCNKSEDEIIVPIIPKPEVIEPVDTIEKKHNELYLTTWETHTIMKPKLQDNGLYGSAGATFHYSKLIFDTDTICSKIDYITTDWNMVEWDSTMAGYHYKYLEQGKMIILTEINDTAYMNDGYIKLGEGNLSVYSKSDKGD